LRARAVFLGPDGRVRALWRIVLFLSLWVVCAAVVVVALGSVLQPLDRLADMPGTSGAVAVTIALLAAHAVMLRMDRRGWEYVGLHRDAARPRVLAAGFALGGAPIAAASLLLLGVGWLAIVPQPDGSWADAAVRVSVGLLPAALYEELLSRGYVFAALAEWLGRGVAVALTSLAFGILHVWNPGWTVVSIGTVVLAGVFLAAVLLATRSLYAAWMAHFAWNWVMAVPLHANVSGLTLAQPDYQVVDAGPDWATGGAWGPEGGAIAAAAIMAVLAVLYLRGRKTGRGTQSGTRTME
jgi:uncharacterized protein